MPIWMDEPNRAIEQFEEAIAGRMPEFGGTFTNSVAMGYWRCCTPTAASGTGPANRRGASRRALPWWAASPNRVCSGITSTALVDPGVHEVASVLYAVVDAGTIGTFQLSPKGWAATSPPRRV